MGEWKKRVRLASGRGVRATRRRRGSAGPRLQMVGSRWGHPAGWGHPTGWGIGRRGPPWRPHGVSPLHGFQFVELFSLRFGEEFFDLSFHLVGDFSHPGEGLLHDGMKGGPVALDDGVDFFPLPLAQAKPLQREGREAGRRRRLRRLGRLGRHGTPRRRRHPMIHRRTAEHPQYKKPGEIQGGEQMESALGALVFTHGFTPSIPLSRFCRGSGGRAVFRFTASPPLVPFPRIPLFFLLLFPRQERCPSTICKNRSEGEGYSPRDAKAAKAKRAREIRRGGPSDTDL